MLKRPIVIIGAMEVEVEELIKKLKNKEGKNIKTYEFYEGIINEYPVVICKSQCMTINASLATFIAIENYNPIAIINIGTAGGNDKNVARGDIVIGKECFNTNSYITKVKKDGEGSNPNEWDYITFVAGGEDKETTEKCDINLLKLANEVKEKYTKGTVHIGKIGSGDSWNREIDRIKFFNQKYQVLCEEMEGIAVYTVANKFNIPVIGIRVISDNEILGQEYIRNLGKDGQEFVYEVILNIVRNIDELKERKL